ncbi:MAG: hypothetical protein ACYDHG_03230 [Desulfomonilaceae bacterium]
MELSFETLVDFAKSKGATDAKLMNSRDIVLDVPTKCRHIN